MGPLVDVGGRRLHLFCQGSGGPTVILEAGKGGYSLDWGRVLPDVAKFTRVCAYDRAGHAWSDAASDPRTLQEIAAELHTLLEKAQVPGPYVMVAHSWGALISQRFAFQYPQQVAGVVFVDGVTDSQLPAPTSPEPPAPPRGSWFSAQNLLRRLGVVRLSKMWKGSEALPAPFDQLPPEYWKPRLAFTILPRALDEQWGEGLPWNESYQQLRAMRDAGPHPFGTLPLVVLSADPEVLTREAAGRLAPEEIEKMKQARQQGQSDLARLSSAGTQRVVQGSGHFIQLQHPHAVIEAIQQVVRAAQGVSAS